MGTTVIQSGLAPLRGAYVYTIWLSFFPLYLQLFVDLGEHD